MKDIIIVGAGHLGVDVYELLLRCNERDPRWRIKGFINDIPVDLASLAIEAPLLGSIKDWQPSDAEVFAMAIGSPMGREKVAKLLKSRGAKFETIVSPHAFVNRSAVIGEGTVILSTSKIARYAEIGEFCAIGDSTIGLRAKIGAYTNTASYSNVYQEVKVGHHVQIWSQAVILNTVGDYATVGAGSVVVSKVKDGTKVFGVPARRMEF